MLKIGSRGEKVIELQQKLNELGFNCGKPDGIFGNGTETAVKDFQRSQNLVVDGLVGNGTLTALDKAKASIQISDPELANSPLPAGQGWIKSDNKHLLESVIHHEGGKEIQYSMYRRGILKAAPGRDFQACIDQNLWPVYMDSLGKPTNGVGHLITGKENPDPYKGITDQQAMDQLAADLKSKVEDAKKLCEDKEVDASNNQTLQMVVIEICFQLGAAGFSKFNNGWKKIKAAQTGQGTWKAACDELKDSRWYRQTPERVDSVLEPLEKLDR